MVTLIIGFALFILGFICEVIGTIGAAMSIFAKPKPAIIGDRGEEIKGFAVDVKIDLADVIRALGQVRAWIALMIFGLVFMALGLGVLGMLPMPRLG